MGAGRPTIHTKSLEEIIVERIISGESLKSICRDDNMPARSTILCWVAKDYCGFMDTYIKACEARAYGLADDIIDIADDGSNDWMEHHDPDNAGYKQNGEAVNRSRLRVDSRKWVVSKLLNRFSDKVDPVVVNNVSNIMPVPTADSAEDWEASARANQEELLKNK